MIKLKFLTVFIILLLTFNSNAAFDIKARTAILQDYLSGEILFEKDPEKSIYPASMTKIMTAIIAFELIRSGDLNLDEDINVFDIIITVNFILSNEDAHPFHLFKGDLDKSGGINIQDIILLLDLVLS